jgi:signal transduction histidine kinase
VVADRRRLVEIGMVAVLVACVTFAITRFVAEQSSGQPTPWWANAIGAVLVAALHLWQRRAPEARTTMAANATAGIAAFALLVPAFYGFTSSKWWLSLVAFAMMLMGRRREAIVWSVTTVLLVGAVTVLEPYLAVANALGESSIETLGAAVAYVVILLGITWAFRRVAEQRARELAETAEQLDRANQVRTRFLAHMSHELRTPLHAVVAMTDLARRGEASDTVREQVSTAQQSIRLASPVVESLAGWIEATAGHPLCDAWFPDGDDYEYVEVMQGPDVVPFFGGIE